MKNNDSNGENGVCIYHSRDLDGWCSAAIVKERYPKVVLLGWDYGQDIPYDKIGNKDLILVDISFPSDVMEKYYKSNRGFVWIDHHVTAINDSKDHEYKGVDGLREIGRGACQLTWEYLYPQADEPIAVGLLGRYDVWEKESDWGSVVLPFQYGMRGITDNPESFPGHLLGEESEDPMTVDEITIQGAAIIRYTDNQNRVNCKRNAFEMEFEGLRAICLNGGGFNTQVFNSVYDPEKHDIMIPFQFNGKQWTVSLYSDKENINVSTIAKNYGGGGHKGASGFVCKKLPWNI